MQQVMLFMSYRTCSKTILNMLGASKKNKSIEEMKFEKIFRGNFFAETKTKNICPVIYRRDGADINYISDKIKDNYSNIIYWTRLENEIHSSFELSNLSQLNGDWKFIVIIRDGRDQINSWMNFKGKRKPNLIEGSGPFLDMCNGWRLRADHAKSIMENFNCKLIKFEDFIKNPYSNFQDVMNFIGLEFDQDYLSSISEVINSETMEKKNNWKDWDKDKLDTFYSIAGKEMEFFNYI